MDLVDGIRVFVAAVESGSFSGAAARLGLSPKLASKYIAELEARLGAQLLQRTTRRLGMTAAGEQLILRAPEWLDQLDDMTGALRDGNRGLAGTLRISAPVTFGEMHVLSAMRRFRSAHPDLVIDLRLSDRFVDLAADGIDVAVRIGRLEPSALMARKLGQTSFVIVASPGYLGRRGVPADPDDLPDHICIRDTNMRGDGTWQLTAAGRSRQIAVSGPYLINSARIARDLALDGEGIALCPDYAVQEDLADGRLVRVLADAEIRSLDIHAVWLGRHRLARRTRALVDFLAADRFAPTMGRSAGQSAEALS